MSTTYEDEILSAITLSRIPRLSLRNAINLYRCVGEASSVINNRHNLKELVPDIADKLALAIENGVEDAMKRAEAEMDFASRHNIECIPLLSPNYPTRLANCDDPPLVLYYRGNADLNAKRIVCVVGTRHCTEYGKDLCRNFTADLANLCPDTIVVSGLAYGVDINAHRCALSLGMKTIGVLAHGLDMIYPSSHRQTAKEMIEQGGILTEFMTNTNPDKGNFVRRNRIVAGMSDACIVIESASKGGALITAELAQDYNRDVFAFPGRITDQYSEGCNNLIRTNKAMLINCAEDATQVLSWTEKANKKKKKSIQLELFPMLSEEETRVVELLRNSDGKQINQLVVESNIAVHKLSSMLFELEMRGIVKAMSGGRYRLLTM